jgi:hypothetical protein
MCQIMDSDPELIALAKLQQEELKSEIQKVGKELGDLRKLATCASTDARYVSENIIGPKVKSVLIWYKAAIVVFSSVITVVGAFTVLWLNANYIPRDFYERDQSAWRTEQDQAWVKQIGINEGGLKQFQSLEMASRLNNQSTEEQKRIIASMQEDIKELRRVLRK